MDEGMCAALTGLSGIEGIKHLAWPKACRRGVEGKTKHQMFSKGAVL